MLEIIYHLLYFIGSVSGNQETRFLPYFGWAKP